MHINHSVAGACSLAIRTPVGTIFHTGDFKFDQTPIDGKPADFAPSRESATKACSACSRTARMPSARAIRFPSASSAKRSPTSSRKRRAAFRCLLRIERSAHSASHRSRDPLRPQVRVSGPLASQRRAFCERIGLSEHTRRSKIRIEDVDEFPPDKIVVMTTGSQGEPMSALTACRCAIIKVQDRSGRYGRDQRDADSRQRKRRVQND